MFTKADENGNTITPCWQRECPECSGNVTYEDGVWECMSEECGWCETEII